MAPEVYEGKSYNSKADVWYSPPPPFLCRRSLGCMLYELLTARRPFQADNVPLLAMRVVSGSYDPLSDSLPPPLRSAVVSMLQKDPTRRPTVDEILATPPFDDEAKRCAIMAANQRHRLFSEGMTAEPDLPPPPEQGPPLYLYVWGLSRAAPMAVEALLHKTIVFCASSKNLMAAVAGAPPLCFNDVSS
jgi:serine/threonine protein kinase